MGYTFNVNGFFRLQDANGQYLRDSTGINANGVLGSTSAVESTADATLTTSDLSLPSGMYATLPAPQLTSRNLAYGISLWFKTTAIITSDGDSGDLTKDLVLLKRYYGSSTEVFGLMLNTVSSNIYSTKLKICGVIYSLPSL